MTESHSGIPRARIKHIPGFPGYLASEDGTIYSDRSGSRKKLSMRLHNGYWHVNVNTSFKKATKVKKAVHQLVLITFVGAKPSLLHVTRHIDGDPLNNHLSNLAWGTTKENTLDSMRHGTAVCLRKGQGAIATKLTPETILSIDRDVKAGERISHVAKRYGITHTHVRRIAEHKCHPDMW
ncbi:HNH endonuclease [Providencia rettgeri]|uniref:HNH endonuclease n=1 Tax=Providencia rettgeri TaxID=587 RepID=UPI0023AA6E25|nr:HNH endonuclease [Providencia rettgeri]